jgi:hypothetical protein
MDTLREHLSKIGKKGGASVAKQRKESGMMEDHMAKMLEKSKAAIQKKKMLKRLDTTNTTTVQ